MIKNNSPVIVGLSGGLGNQLFQYAAGRALTIRLQTYLVLDLSWFANQKERSFSLSPFQIHAQTYSQFPRLATSLQGTISKISRRLMPRAMGVRVWREPHFNYSEEFVKLTEPVYMEGYWQSERYFSEIRPLLLEEITLKDPMPSECMALFETIRSCNAICVHVRRGDYLSNPVAAKVHGICPADYYHLSVTELCAGLADPHCFIFSDDPVWVRNSLTFDCPTTVVDLNSPNDAHFDLMLMAACQHFVIANSSLSWWGAWLGSHSDKVVIAPKRWFLTQDKNTSDLLPESWLKR